MLIEEKGNQPPSFKPCNLQRSSACNVYCCNSEIDVIGLTSYSDLIEDPFHEMELILATSHLVKNLRWAFIYNIFYTLVVTTITLKYLFPPLFFTNMIIIHFIYLYCDLYVYTFLQNKVKIAS